MSVESGSLPLTAGGGSLASDELPTDLVELGRLSGAHGVRGAVKITPYGPAADSVLRRSGRCWLTAIPPAAAKLLQVSKEPWPVTLSGARIQIDLIVAQLEGVADRDLATAMKGARVWRSRASFPPVEADEFYWVDLIGCQVVDPAGQALGEVVAVEEYGADPLLKVHGPDGVDRLIPFVKATIQSVDLSARKIVADWGLDY